MRSFFLHLVCSQLQSYLDIVKVEPLLQFLFLEDLSWKCKESGPESWKLKGSRIKKRLWFSFKFLFFLTLPPLFVWSFICFPSPCILHFFFCWCFSSTFLCALNFCFLITSYPPCLTLSGSLLASFRSDRLSLCVSGAIGDVASVGRGQLGWSGHLSDSSRGLLFCIQNCLFHACLSKVCFGFFSACCKRVCLL